jgi:hypothetical protein
MDATLFLITDTADYKKAGVVSASSITILSRVRVTLDGVLDWRLDLLTTSTHNS